MNPKKYVRDEADGTHWPDADTGDNLYYGIDFTDYLSSIIGDSDLPTLQIEEITTIIWDIPEGITSDDNFIEGNVGVIKVKSDSIGNFKIICNLNTTSSAKTQLQKIPMILTVY